MSLLDFSAHSTHDIFQPEDIHSSLLAPACWQTFCPDHAPWYQIYEPWLLIAVAPMCSLAPSIRIFCKCREKGSHDLVPISRPLKDGPINRGAVMQHLTQELLLWSLTLESYYVTMLSQGMHATTFILICSVQETHSKRQCSQARKPRAWYTYASSRGLYKVIWDCIRVILARLDRGYVGLSSTSIV